MDQDWTPVVLRKDKPKPKPPTFVQPAGVPKIGVDADGNETIKVKKVSHTTAQFIIQSRTQKNLKQTDLAKMCNLDSKIIGDIERGGCIYNFQHINKISKALGVKIPRD